MQKTSDLRRRYDQERRKLTFDALPRLDDQGLTLGRGTRLVRAVRGNLPECFDLEAERAVVLLATAHQRVVPFALKHLRRAIESWQRGDAALAHIELAFARLPRLESETDSFRLFLAETLLDGGLTPRALGRELHLDLEKYDPNQPRIPAGNGQKSGRWGQGPGRAPRLG